MEGWQTQLVAAPAVEVAQRLHLTVLLPAYNEAEAIERVLREIVEALSECRSTWLTPSASRRPSAARIVRTHLQLAERQLAERVAHIPSPLAERVAHTPLEYEILVVDDASTDGTAEVVEAFAAECWQCAVRLLRCPENRGAGAARKVGIRAARGEIIVMLDADGTYPAAAIPELLRHFPAYDQVNGARTAERGTLPWLRAAAKWAIRKLACYLTGKHIPDLNTGLKAFRRDAMLPWLWVVPDGFSCVTTMTLAFLTNGYAVKYVPVEYRRRIGRSKFHIVRDTLSYLSTVVRIVLYFRPLRVFAPLAALVLATGAAKSLWSFHATGSMQESDIVVLVAGFMTLMLGMLAEVIVAHHRR